MVDPVRQIADAVLYEGHVLWPYRPSSVKNRQRWTFGGVYPPAYALATGDRARVFFECLVEGDAPHFDLEVRFLQLVRPEGAAWDVAIERAVGIGAIDCE